jgi:hypothetical protein
MRIVLLYDYIIILLLKSVGIEVAKSPTAQIISSNNLKYNGAANNQVHGIRIDLDTGERLDGLIISDNLCSGFYWGISFLSGTIADSLIHGNNLKGNKNGGINIQASLVNTKVEDNLA